MSTPDDRDREPALAGADDDAIPPTAGAPVPPARRGNLGLLIGLLAVGGGIVALMLTSFQDAAVYAMSVDQVLASAGTLGSRRLRVEGNLVKGTLEKRDQPCEYRFRIVKAGQELPVRYPQCIVPDTFRDVPGMDVGVTVEGKLAASGEFEASQVMAKCPSKYEMKDRAAHGEQMPHADIAPGADIR